MCSLHDFQLSMYSCSFRYACYHLLSPCRQQGVLKKQPRPSQPRGHLKAPRIPSECCRHANPTRSGKRLPDCWFHGSLLPKHLPFRQRVLDFGFQSFIQCRRPRPAIQDASPVLAWSFSMSCCASAASSLDCLPFSVHRPRRRSFETQPIGSQSLQPCIPDCQDNFPDLPKPQFRNRPIKDYATTLQQKHLATTVSPGVLSQLSLAEHILSRVISNYPSGTTGYMHTC